MALASMGHGVASFRKCLNFTAVSSSATNTPEIGTAADGDRPAEPPLCGAPAARTSPDRAAGCCIPFSWNFGQDQDTFCSQRLLFCVLSSPPPSLASSACSLSLRICGLLKRLRDTEYMPRLLLATKQLFLDGGSVHSGGQGQGKEGQPAGRRPCNADAQAPSVAFPGCVTSSKWLHLSEFPSTLPLSLNGLKCR